METICGECNKPYSKECENKVFCRIHKRVCFQCTQCKQPDADLMLIRQSSEKCYSCQFQCTADEVFYDYQCDKYICKKEFKNIDYSKAQIALPCGCQYQKEHVVAFMSNFCLQCLRKLANPDPWEVRLCSLCIKKNESLPLQASFSLKSLKKTIDPLLSWLKAPTKEIPSEKTPLPEVAQQKKEDKKNEQLIIQILNQDFKKINEQLKVSEFTRMELRKSLLHSERDRQCLICNQNYTLSNKPMMICMQQHLICEICFKEKISLINCPLCSQNIQRDKVRVSRQRLRTLELEGIFTERYESKFKRYLNYCNNDFQKLRYQFDIKDAETQTLNEPPKAEEKIVEKESSQQQCTKKRGRPVTRAQSGSKRQKK